MIQVTKTELKIIITDAAPLERRNWLMKAIIASIKWNSMCTEADKDKEDGNNLFALCELLEALIEQGK